MSNPELVKLADGLDAALKRHRLASLENPSDLRAAHAALGDILFGQTEGIAAAIRLVAQNGWQPIETAPKDRFILLLCPEDGTRWLAKWQGQRWYGIDDMGLTREGSSVCDGEVVTGWKIYAWQDLPPAAAL